MPRPPIPAPGARSASLQARQVAAALRPGYDLRSGFVGLTGAMHLEWADGVSRLLSPERVADLTSPNM